MSMQRTNQQWRVVRERCDGQVNVWTNTLAWRSQKINELGAANLRTEIAADV
jgi:hypothetical protein